MIGCTELLILLSLRGIKYVFRCLDNTFKEKKKVKSKDEKIEIIVTKSKTNKFHFYLSLFSRFFVAISSSSKSEIYF